MPFISLGFQDSYGRRTRKLLELETQVDLAAYQAAVAAVVAAMQDVTDLGLVRVDLILDAIVAGFAAVAGSNVDVGATFSGEVTDGNGKRASFKLPGIKPAFVNPDGSIDITAVAIDALLDLFLAAGPLNLSDGETIALWLAGMLDK